MSRRLCLLLCAVPVSWLLLAAAGPCEEPKEEDAAPKDLVLLQGKWRETERDGNGRVEKIDRGLIIEFDKDTKIEYDALALQRSEASEFSWPLLPRLSRRGVAALMVLEQVL